MSSLNGSFGESVSLEWVGELCFPPNLGPKPYTVEPATEQDLFNDVILLGWLLEANSWFKLMISLRSFPAPHELLFPKLLSCRLSAANTHSSGNMAQ